MRVDQKLRVESHSMVSSCIVQLDWLPKDLSWPWPVNSSFSLKRENSDALRNVHNNPPALYPVLEAVEMSSGSYEQRWLVVHPHDGCLFNVSIQFDVMGRYWHVVPIQTAEDRKHYSSTVSFSSPYALTRGHRYGGRRGLGCCLPWQQSRRGRTTNILNGKNIFCDQQFLNY
jgi:hypothetical protein